MEKRAWIDVDFPSICDNIDKMKKTTGRKFLACVKADCYGMGMSSIARGIEKKADFFGVAETSEAISLREGGIRKPVLVMGSMLPGDADILAVNNIRITLCNREMLKKIASVAAKRNIRVNVHIKIDTGLGRIGVMPGEAVDFIEEASKVKGIRIEGIFTHLATADWDDDGYARGQLGSFMNILRKVESMKIPIRHIANSAALIKFPETYRDFDMVRIGLLFLGVYPDRKLHAGLPLKPALSGHCRVLYLKDVPRGTGLSYGITYRTRKDITKVATVGIGYGDGYKRFLSNRYWMEYKGKKLRILGNVCMDQTLVDATGTGLKTGETLRIFGDRFEIEEMAVRGNTVPQEILCGFGSRRMEKIYKK